MKTKILAAVVVIILIAAGIGYWQYNKPHPDAATGEVAYSVSAAALFEEFDHNEQKAAEKYVNKLLEVSGTVKETSTESDNYAMIVLDSEHPLFGVKAMFQSPLLNPVETGTKVTIRGFCSGINGDVELTRCTIIQS